MRGKKKLWPAHGFMIVSGFLEPFHERFLQVHIASSVHVNAPQKKSFSICACHPSRVPMLNSSVTCLKWRFLSSIWPKFVLQTSKPGGAGAKLHDVTWPASSRLAPPLRSWKWQTMPGSLMSAFDVANHGRIKYQNINGGLRASFSSCFHQLPFRFLQLSYLFLLSSASFFIFSASISFRLPFSDSFRCILPLCSPFSYSQHEFITPTFLTDTISISESCLHTNSFLETYIILKI